MPRRIVSQDPLTIPSVPEKVFDSMLVTHFESNSDEGGTKVKVTLSPQNNTTKEIAGQGQFHFTVDEWDSQLALAPKLSAAWDSLNDAMGLAYDFFRLQEKVRKAQSNGEDATALIAARNAALAALRAPVV